MGALKSKQRREDQEAKGKEARLNRLAEEVERYKAQLRETKNQGGEDTEKSRREVDRLAQENKRLERQKNELVAAFKKQLKLIDILKRQKLHLEGARMLQFTEDEFMKTLEMGDRA